ncbi:hypothetical protein QOT17_014497 [Balamuthia mandrillaris]
MEATNATAVFIPTDDGSLPCKPEELRQLLAERRQFELDQYYDHIQPHTFDTRFVAFSLEEAKAWREYNRGAAELSKEEEGLLAGLKARLEEAIQVFVERGNAAFVRLSTRSPKDAVDKDEEALRPLLVEALLQQQQRSRKASLDELDANDCLIALRKAFFQRMRVTSADQVFQLMMYSNRTVSDMKRAIDHADKIEWNLGLIVREFVAIDIEGELRAFVHNKQLNALSQYFADCYFAGLHEHKDEVQERVLQFFEQVKEDIPFDSYNIDFAVSKDRVYILELKYGCALSLSCSLARSLSLSLLPFLRFNLLVSKSPFSESTGGALFDWKKDRNVLEEGPFEFRTVPEENACKNLMQPWKGLVDRAIHHHLHSTEENVLVDEPKRNNNHPDSRCVLQ